MGRFEENAWEQVSPKQLRPGIDLEIDGGVDLHTIGAAAQAGARVFVAGSSVFHAKEGIGAAVKNLIKIASNG